MTRKYYAGIGSRETPDHVLSTMTTIAHKLREKDYILRSGGAVGADSAFEAGAGLDKDIFYAQEYIPLWCQVFTDYFHPAPDRLGYSHARRLMHRNAMQILGPSGDEPVDFVICWTRNGAKVGGTAQAIRIADYYGIKVYNLALNSDIHAINERFLT